MILTRLILLSGLLLGTAVAHAGPIVLTANAPQTVAGQNFQFDFAAPLSDGTAGLFTFRARGDYTIGASLGESVDINLDGVLFFNDLQATAGNVITNFSFDDNLWQVAFAISGAALTAMTADNALSIFVDVAGGVGLNLATAFVDVKLEYNSAMVSVPEPSTLGILGLGLLGLAFARRKRA